MKLFPRKLRRASAQSDRTGAAVVEFAVCLPLILLIVLGSIEAANLLFLRQALIQSSYEGAKVAIRNEATNAAVENIAVLVAQGRRVEDFSVTTVPANIENVESGQFIRVQSSAPADSNGFLSSTIFGNRTITAEAVMVKE